MLHQFRALPLDQRIELEEFVLLQHLKDVDKAEREIKANKKAHREAKEAAERKKNQAKVWQRGSR